MKKTAPIEECFWYGKKKPEVKKFSEDLSCEIAIIGGGIAGLSAALKLSKEGYSVVILEATFCGGGASGKSSGFITPDSELELSDLLRNYGEVEARKLWKFACDGVENIRNNINEFAIECDYQIQDSLFIANKESEVENPLHEHRTRLELGFSSNFYDKDSIKNIIGGNKFFGGVRYQNTFGMNGYLYCQGLKDILIKRGVKIYEGSPVTKIDEKCLTVNGKMVKAEKIIACMDRFLPKLDIANDEIYSAQTFLSISEPLTENEIKKIFPQEKMMVWDTDLIYQYFRITGDNRLLFGAADMLYTYLPNEKMHPIRILAKMERYLGNKFPDVPITLSHIWPGLIGVSKDFAPIAGQVKDVPWLYFIGGGAGLPWSAALGEYVADKIKNGRGELDKYFDYKRSFPIGPLFQHIISKPVSFAISHGIKKYFYK